MKNEYQVNRALIRSWAKEYNLRGFTNILLFVFWCLIGLIGAMLLIGLIVAGGHWILWCAAIELIACSVYKLWVARFVIWARRYKASVRRYGVTEWTRSTEFGDEDITVTEHTTVGRVRYQSLRKIREKGNAVIIFTDENFVLRLYKDAFVEGSWEECKQLLERKMKD